MNSFRVRCQEPITTTRSVPTAMEKRWRQRENGGEFAKLLEKLVEAAGVEPASESTPSKDPTCVSPFVSRDRPGKEAKPPVASSGNDSPAPAGAPGAG